MFKVGIKILLFPVFLTVLYLAISYVTDMVSPYIVGNQIVSFIAYLGILDALTLYFSILISGWGIKQILNYVSRM